VATARPSDRAVAGVRRRLFGWWQTNGRTDLAFRRSRDRWPVLVAEVMLQQTQASRINERFDPFMARYPTPRAMADASAAAVLADWSGLGYNRRALSLHRTARQIAEDGWPETVAGFESLPGIGPYSARAVASIALGQPVGVVDTNVRRWLVRRFAADPADRAHLQALADRLAEAADGDPGSWTHATMEFGARICTARAPQCDACPISQGCPSRGHAQRVPVGRQNAATASARAARGAAVRRLASAANHWLPAGTLDPATRDALVRDGLAHRRGQFIHLGPEPEGGGAPGTIGR
jgi:A/G-specific adenine glycosylase